MPASLPIPCASIAAAYRKIVGSSKSPKFPDIFTITFKRTTEPWARYPQLLPANGAAAQGKACGFILVVEDGEVDAYNPSGDLLGVFGDRIDAAEAVLRCGVHIGRLNH